MADLSCGGDWHTIAQRTQRNNPPSMVGHVFVRLQRSIVVCVGEFQLDNPVSRARDIWVCNLYIELWSNYNISEFEKAPGDDVTRYAYGFAIGQSVYIVSRLDINMTTLWKLTRNRKGYFSWSDIVVNRAPSFRGNSASCE